MTLSQLKSAGLQIEALKLQNDINSAPEIRSDDPDAETKGVERRVKVDQLVGLNTKVIAELEKEDLEAQAAQARNVDASGMTPELRDFRDLAQKTDFETYFKAAVQGSEIREGAEKEYNQHVFGDNWGLGDLPLEIFLDRDEVPDPNVIAHLNERWGSKEYEKRTAITGTANNAANLTYVERLFADSDAIYIGASMPAVGPGRHSFPIVGSTVASQATAVARGTQQTPAGGITIENADPESIRAAFTIANVDELVMPGIGAYLQSDIRAHLMGGLDNKVIDDAVSELNVAASRTEDTVTITLAKLFQKFGQTVNGIAAKSVNDVRMLVAGTPATTGTYGVCSALVEANVGNFFTMVPHDRFRASPHFAAPATNRQHAIAYRTAPPRGTRGIVAPVWRRVNLLRDPFSESDRDQTSFRGTLYADVVVASAQQHHLHQFDLA